MNRAPHRRLAIAAAALVAGLLLAGPAFAKAKPPSPYAAQIKELREVRTLLQKADRDYKGHRAAAVKELTAAVHALHPNKKAHAGKGAKGAKGAKGIKRGEPQALSDAQLKDSIKALNTVVAQLKAAPGSPATKAAAHVTTAIKELEVALTIK
jgi:hypothetical protein